MHNPPKHAWEAIVDPDDNCIKVDPPGSRPHTSVQSGYDPKATPPLKNEFHRPAPKPPLGNKIVLDDIPKGGNRDSVGERFDCLDWEFVRHMAQIMH